MGLVCAAVLAAVFVCPAAMLTAYRTNGAYPGDKVPELFDIDLQQLRMCGMHHMLPAPGTRPGLDGSTRPSHPIQQPYHPMQSTAWRCLWPQTPPPAPRPRGGYVRNPHHACHWDPTLTLWVFDGCSTAPAGVCRPAVSGGIGRAPCRRLAVCARIPAGPVGIGCLAVVQASRSISVRASTAAPARPTG
jgi:hypothetical protein